ncbi:MAG: plastocyanin/azurin family copper-binding protein [Nitrososphaerales archaeon]
MVDWDLMIPGMGLTLLGMGGVGLSLAGIARTFMEGMHALSALVMFIGLIILATGLLKDGLPRSGTAKASVLIIVGLLVSLGVFLLSFSTVPTLPLFAGVLLLIFAPATVIAYAAHKETIHFRAIAILFSSASVVGALAFFSFGFVAPQPIEAGVLEKAEEVEEIEEEITGPKVEVTILEGAGIEGNPAYDPAEITVERGTAVVWTNADSVVHTVTSGSFDDPDFGSLFDSLTMGAEKTYVLDTSELEVGEYAYFCTFHPFMKATLIVVPESESEEEDVLEDLRGESMLSTVTVDIAEGSAAQDNPEFFAPAEITVSAGTTVVWTNKDVVGHTVTSGNPSDAETGTIFDSGFPLMKQGEQFEHAFDTPGAYEYFCLVHPHMVGKVTVT